METVTLSPKARALVGLLEDRRGQFVRVEWTSTPAVAAANKGRVTKRVVATTRTGVDFANMAVNKDRETGALPWGEWALFPWIIVHKDREYLRLTGASKVETLWFVDGVRATREEALALFTPSGRKAAESTEPVTAFTVALESVRTVGDTALAA